MLGLYCEALKSFSFFVQLYTSSTRGHISKTNRKYTFTDNMKYRRTTTKEILTVKVRMEMKYSWEDKLQDYLMLLNVVISFRMQSCSNLKFSFLLCSSVLIIYMTVLFQCTKKGTKVAELYSDRLFNNSNLNFFPLTLEN